MRQQLSNFISNTRISTAKATSFAKFVLKIRPKRSFDVARIPPEPDYDDLENWAVHPHKKGKSDLIPKGLKPNNKAKKADVFFIHPTSYFGNYNWNYPFDDNLTTLEMTDEMIVPSQATVFNESCSIFAPRYRLATFYTFLQPCDSGRRALELAYSDIERAFDYFIKKQNHGRPFFIASHSQGSLHAMRLLEEKIENSELRHQMVAAYVVGFRFPIEKFGTAFKNLQPSESPTDTGTIIAWDTYIESGKYAHFIDLAEIWYSTPSGKGAWKLRSRKKVLGVNPLTWTRDLELADKSKNLGAIHIVSKSSRGFKFDNLIHKDGFGINTSALSAPQIGEVSAQLGKKGFLYISKPKNHHFKLAILPFGNYHNYDYGLFYMNIRKNIKDRLDAFLKKQSTKLFNNEG